MWLRTNGYPIKTRIIRLWLWFHSLTRFKQIGVSVLLVHTLIIMSLFISHLVSGEPKKKKSIAIRTTTVLPRPSSPQVAAAPILPVLPSKKVIATPPLSPKPLKTTPQKKPADDLLSKIAESLESLATAPKAPKVPNFAPSLPPSIQIQPEAMENPNYGETVSSVLQNSLDLPEFGKVIVKIEIDRNGNVIQCQILDSQSRKNGEFLKKRLQELSFPCFNQFGITENQLNFTVTFQNAENT